jgi:hypothetical protein
MTSTTFSSQSETEIKNKLTGPAKNAVSALSKLGFTSYDPNSRELIDPSVLQNSYANLVNTISGFNDPAEVKKLMTAASRVLIKAKEELKEVAQKVASDYTTPLTSTTGPNCDKLGVSSLLLDPTIDSVDKFKGVVTERLHQMEKALTLASSYDSSIDVRANMALANTLAVGAVTEFNSRQSAVDEDNKNAANEVKTIIEQQIEPTKKDPFGVVGLQNQFSETELKAESSDPTIEARINARVKASYESTKQKLEDIKTNHSALKLVGYDVPYIDSELQVLEAAFKKIENKTARDSYRQKLDDANKLIADSSKSNNEALGIKLDDLQTNGKYDLSKVKSLIGEPSKNTYTTHVKDIFNRIDTASKDCPHLLEGLTKAKDKITAICKNIEQEAEKAHSTEIKVTADEIAKLVNDIIKKEHKYFFTILGLKTTPDDILAADSDITTQGKHDAEIADAAQKIIEKLDLANKDPQIQAVLGNLTVTASIAEINSIAASLNTHANRKAYALALKEGNAAIAAVNGRAGKDHYRLLGIDIAKIKDKKGVIQQAKIDELLKKDALGNYSNLPELQKTLQQLEAAKLSCPNISVKSEALIKQLNEAINTVKDKDKRIDHDKQHNLHVEPEKHWSIKMATEIGKKALEWGAPIVPIVYGVYPLVNRVGLELFGTSNVLQGGAKYFPASAAFTQNAVLFTSIGLSIGAYIGLRKIISKYLK